MYLIQLSRDRYALYLREDGEVFYMGSFGLRDILYQGWKVDHEEPL